jgi:redox-sensitive bicupin YhaK (pirin superfamily)
MSSFVFFYDGSGNINIQKNTLQQNSSADINVGEEIVIKNSGVRAKLLILEGEPINEPVAAYGPSAMNTKEEMYQAFADYLKTQSGGWPWGNEEIDVVHQKDAGRFTSYNFVKELAKPKI